MTTLMAVEEVQQYQLLVEEDRGAEEAPKLLLELQPQRPKHEAEMLRQLMITLQTWHSTFK